MKQGTQADPKTGVPVDSVTAAFIRGACIAIALFARRQCSPRQALRAMGFTREDAEQSGAMAFDLVELKPHWPKVSRIKTRTKARQ